MSGKTFAWGQDSAGNCRDGHHSSCILSWCGLGWSCITWNSEIYTMIWFQGNRWHYSGHDGQGGADLYSAYCELYILYTILYLCDWNIVSTSHSYKTVFLCFGQASKSAEKEVSAVPSSTSGEPCSTPTVADVNGETCTPSEPEHVNASPDASVVTHPAHGAVGTQPGAAADVLTRKAMVLVQWMSPEWHVSFIKSKAN